MGRMIQLSDIAEISSCVNHILADEFSSCASVERQQDVKLCLYELLGNALIHGSGDNEICVRYKIEDDCMLLQVYEAHGIWDGVHFLNNHRCLKEGILEEHGRGLYLVEMLSEEFAYCHECKGVRVMIRLKGGPHGEK